MRWPSTAAILRVPAVCSSSFLGCKAPAPRGDDWCQKPSTPLTPGRCRAAAASGECAYGTNKGHFWTLDPNGLLSLLLAPLARAGARKACARCLQLDRRPEARGPQRCLRAFLAGKDTAGRRGAAVGAGRGRGCVAQRCVMLERLGANCSPILRA